MDIPPDYQPALDDGKLVVAHAGLKETFQGRASGRMITDRWRLKLPLIGRLSHLFAMTQFTRSLAILLGGGTPSLFSAPQVQRTLRLTQLLPLLEVFDDETEAVASFPAA